MVSHFLIFINRSIYYFYSYISNVYFRSFNY